MSKCEHKNVSPIKWEGRDFHVYCPGCDTSLVLKNCTILPHDEVSSENVEVAQWTFKAQSLIGYEEG